MCVVPILNYMRPILRANKVQKSKHRKWTDRSPIRPFSICRLHNIQYVRIYRCKSVFVYAQSKSVPPPPLD